MKKIQDKKIQVNFSFSVYRLIERLIFIGIIIFLWNLFQQKNIKLQEQKNLVEAAKDTLKTWTTKDGKNMAKIAVLETQQSKTLEGLSTQNQTITELKWLVKSNARLLKKQGSASIIKSETSIDTLTNTQVSFDLNNSPIYKGFIENKWYSIKSTATKDSTRYKLKTFSNLSLTIGREKQGLFKKSKPYGIANDANPYTNIKDMRIYQVSLPPTKRFGLGVYGGYGATKIGQEVKTGWQIGVGGSYQLIQF